MENSSFYKQGYLVGIDLDNWIGFADVNYVVNTWSKEDLKQFIKGVIAGNYDSFNNSHGKQENYPIDTHESITLSSDILLGLEDLKIILLNLDIKSKIESVIHYSEYELSSDEISKLYLD